MSLINVSLSEHSVRDFLSHVLPADTQVSASSCCDYPPPEGEFMNVQFLHVSEHNLESSHFSASVWIF
jgi:hypothetical protein